MRASGIDARAHGARQHCVYHYSYSQVYRAPLLHTHTRFSSNKAAAASAAAAAVAEGAKFAGGGGRLLQRLEWG